MPKPPRFESISPSSRPVIDTTTSTPLTRIAMLGNHTPRQCGIATFTAD